MEYRCQHGNKLITLNDDGTITYPDCGCDPEITNPAHWPLFDLNQLTAHALDLLTRPRKAGNKAKAVNVLRHVQARLARQAGDADSYAQVYDAWANNFS